MSEQAQSKGALPHATNHFQGKDVQSLLAAFAHHLEYSLAKDEYAATWDIQAVPITLQDGPEP